MRGDVHGFDAGAIERELEIMTLKFRSMIVNNSLRARVSRQPVIFEERFGVFCCFRSCFTMLFGYLCFFMFFGSL